MTLVINSHTPQASVDTHQRSLKIQLETILSQRKAFTSVSGLCNVQLIFGSRNSVVRYGEGNPIVPVYWQVRERVPLSFPHEKLRRILGPLGQADYLERGHKRKVIISWGTWTGAMLLTGFYVSETLPWFLGRGEEEREDGLILNIVHVPYPRSEDPNSLMGPQWRHWWRSQDFLCVLHCMFLPPPQFSLLAPPSNVLLIFFHKNRS